MDDQRAREAARPFAHQVVIESKGSLLRLKSIYLERLKQLQVQFREVLGESRGYVKDVLREFALETQRQAKEAAAFEHKYHDLSGFVIPSDKETHDFAVAVPLTKLQNAPVESTSQADTIGT